MQRVIATAQRQVSLDGLCWISYTHAGVLVGWKMGRSMTDTVRRQTWSKWQQKSRGALVDVVQDGVDAAAAYRVWRVEPAQKQQHTTH
jgi:hypothetical protein